MANLFVSDLHLEDQRPDILRAFFRLLDEQKIDLQRIYLLGDIFEVWLGDDTPSSCADALAEKLSGLAREGIEIFLLHGNRDFLIGSAYAARCGATLLNEPVLLNVAGRPTALLHGDSLCTLDTDYMAFRKMVRDPQWIEQFLAKPLNERIAIGRSLREQSRQSAQQKQEYIMDVTPDEVLATLRDLKVELLIHGHTHRPAVHDLMLDGKAVQRLVLGDWHTQGWYLLADDNDIQLKSFPFSGD